MDVRCLLIIIVKPPVRIVKALARIVKPLALIVKPPVRIVKALARIVEPLARIVKPPVRIVKALAHIVEPPARIVKPFTKKKHCRNNPAVLTYLNFQSLNKAVLRRVKPILGGYSVFNPHRNFRQRRITRYPVGIHHHKPAVGIHHPYIRL